MAASALVASSTAPIRSISDALKLSAFDGLGPWPFVLEGQMYSSGGATSDFKDATGGYPVEDHRDSGPTPSIGDIVRISGDMVITAKDLHRFRVRHLDILGNAPLPPPITLTDANVENPNLEYSFAHAQGVVTAIVPDDLDTNYRQLILKMQNRSVEIAVSCRLFPHTYLKSLLDAEIEAFGLYRRKSGWRLNIGMHLLLNRKENLKVLKPPPEDPFAVPELHGPDSPHRRRMAGKVIASSNGRFFMTTRTGRFMEVLVADDTATPKSGDCVETSGFTELDPFLLRLSEAVVRPTSEQFPPLPPPQDVELARLFKHASGVDRIDTAMHGQVIRFTGKVSDLLDGTSPDTFFVQSAGRSVSVDMSGLDPPRNAPEPGSEVSVTGLCLSEFKDDLAHRSIPRFRRYVILPRTIGDIVVMSRPPWWTPTRLLLVIAILAAALVAVLAWNRTLRVLSERRGRQLYREQLGHVLAEKKTEERGRLAVELHDSISQTLTGVAMQVDAASQADASRPGSARPYLDAAKMLLASCRHELRCCIWDLRSRTFEEKDMAEAIVRTVRPHVGDIDLAVRFNVPRRNLSESTIHAILRIVRELSVNAVRHGDAARIRIAGECNGSTIRFSVQDDGSGFDPAQVGGATSGHFGLQGIRERLRAFNGRLEVESRPGGGTKATVTLDAPELRETTCARRHPTNRFASSLSTTTSLCAWASRPSYRASRACPSSARRRTAKAHWNSSASSIPTW